MSDIDIKILTAARELAFDDKGSRRVFRTNEIQESLGYNRFVKYSKPPVHGNKIRNVLKGNGYSPVYGGFIKNQE